MQRQSIAGMCVALLLGCGQTTRVPAHTDFEIGASRDQVLRAYGEPERTTVFHKTDDRIWGAIEIFWLTVPKGSAVEIWSYPSQHSSMGHGDTELYYVNDSALVSGLSFSPEGVVYESNGGV
jgi:hypothetical protein